MILYNNFYIKKIHKTSETRTIFFIASIVGVLNIIFLTSYIISNIIIFVELCILGYYFFRKDITRYLGYYLIFLCLSFEYEVLVGTSNFYGFKDFRILGINLGILTLLPILLLMITKKIKIKTIKDNSPSFLKFSKIFVTLCFSGVFFGLIQILINDNNIHTLGNVISIFIGITYNMTVVPILLIISFTYLILFENDKVDLLEKFMLAILLGVVVSMITSLLTGKFGRYGGVDILLVSNNHFYIPFMLLLPFYNKNGIDIKIIFLFGAIGAVLLLLYNSSGKVIMLYSMVPIGIMWMLWRKKKILLFTFILFVSPCILLILLNVVENLTASSIIFGSKMNELVSFLKIWESDWLNSMPLSPRTRIAEFINIFYEYMNKPWFFLLGKGYMGTIIDHTGLLTSEFISGAFSNNQWNQGVFYRMHESLNVLFLYNGIVGLLFYVFMIKEVFKKFTYSPWILVGGAWFILIYGYSVTMTAYGFTALLLGFINYDKQRMYLYDKGYVVKI